MTKNKTASGLIRADLAGKVDAQHGEKRDRGERLQRDPATSGAPDRSKSVTDQGSEGRHEAYKREFGADPAAAAPVHLFDCQSLTRCLTGYEPSGPCSVFIEAASIEPVAGSGRIAP